MSYPQQTTAVLLDTDTTILAGADLSEAFGIKFDDPLNRLGRGSTTLARDHPDIDQVYRGRYIEISTGITVFTFRIEGNPEYKQIARDGKMQEVAVFSGRIWGGAMWEEAITFPEGSLEASLDSSFRLWSFASISFPNAGTWDPATELYEYLDGVAYGLRIVEAQSAVDAITGDPIYDIFPAPLAFPWPIAPKNGPDGPLGAYHPTYWTWPQGAAEDDVGFAFFRGTFSLAGQQPITFDVTGDNYFTLYVQGVPILGEKANSLCWTGWKTVTLELPAGTYQVAALVENIYADIPYNPGGFLCACYISTVYPGEVATTPTLAVLTSDDTWDSYFSPDEYPGFTPGQALEQFATEAIANGALQFFDGVTSTAFTDTDGDPWDSSDPDTEIEFMPSLSTKIGSTGVDMLDKMVQEGWIDFHFRGDIAALDVWAQGSAGATTSAVFARGVNIVDLQLGATKPYANALLVQWGEKGGFVKVEDATAIAANDGSKVWDIYSTDAGTQYEAERLGRVELQRRVGSSRSSIRMAIEPTGVDDVPYVDFQPGDYVTIPNEAETGTREVRVLTIALDSDEKGKAIWALELNTPWLDPGQATNDLLRSIGGKSLGTVRDLGIVRL